MPPRVAELLPLPNLQLSVLFFQRFRSLTTAHCYMLCGSARCWLRRLGFDDRLHVRKALFELAAHNFLAIHDKTDRLGHEVALSGHAPGELRLIALWLNFHVDIAGPFE